MTCFDSKSVLLEKAVLLYLILNSSQLIFNALNMAETRTKETIHLDVTEFKELLAFFDEIKIPLAQVGPGLYTCDTSGISATTFYSTFARIYRIGTF